MIKAKNNNYSGKAVRSFWMYKMQLIKILDIIMNRSMKALEIEVR